MKYVDFTTAKKGDIMFITYGDSIGEIYMFDHVENNLIYWLCSFNIDRNQFNVSDGRTHLGFANETRKEFMFKEATNAQQCLLLSMMDKFGYYFDEDDNELKDDDVPEVGKPKITWDDTDNHVMEVKGLNGLQHNIIEELFRSWNNG